MSKPQQAVLAMGKFLRYHGVRYTKRQAAGSDTYYYEVSVGNTVKLIRIADHSGVTNRMTWHPDYNIESNADFRRFKKQFRNALLEMY
jgi:hypothetical protein